MTNPPKIVSPRLKIQGYAPGYYMCRCSDCGETHTADKRAWRCEKCADAAARASEEAAIADAMTHPTTEQSIRERLHSEAKRYLSPNESDTNIWAALDAVLSDLKSPSEGMKIAAMKASGVGPASVRATWQAMIRHIRDGGK